MMRDGDAVKTTVGIFMPCHSTPWRSHLVHPGIDVWALTCEPPLNIPLNRRASYLDEADHFYADPQRWIVENMASLRGMKAGSRRPWPEKLVFFEQLESTMKGVLGTAAYKECWRGFNSHWHDDWRRRGDVVVWCKS
jgi:GPI mannosyltransferase 3